MSSPNRTGGLALTAVLLMSAWGAGASPPAVVTGEVALFGPPSAPGSVNMPFVADARFTPMDLLRRAFPDLDNDGHYRQLLPLKVVKGATMPEIGAGYSQGPGEPALTMHSPSKAVVRDGRHAIGFVLGAGVLVSDWLLPVPAVGEAIFVQTDPGSNPTIERAFPIRVGEAAALVSNSHFNEGEGVEAYRLYAQGFSGLREVYDGPSLYSFFPPDEQFGHLQMSQVLAGVRPLATRHNGYADIAMTVTDTTSCTNNEDADSTVRQFSFTLTWDARAKRYRGGSPALERLNRRRLAVREKE